MKKTVLLFLMLFCIERADAQSRDSLAAALDIIGLTFSENDLDSMGSIVGEQKSNFLELRQIPVKNSLSYPLIFSPPLNNEMLPDEQIDIDWALDSEAEMPNNKADLAFFPVYRLAALIKNKKITSLELTQFFLDRLRKYGDTLSCVITLTDSLALAQAKRADEELQNGIYRGPLHGIPYGAKDLLAVEGYKTTWGAMPYKDQELDYNATVIEKLEESGAVLTAKLTLGALAWGDVWYGGQTKNPWNLREGSSGSSAGSASAAVAGLVPFAIGTETYGSIVSPSTQCGATGLRPTFGRVSRHGAMALSWSMDKIGPICRNAVDCAIVLEAIRGEDGLDRSVKNVPFNYDYPKGIDGLRIGILSEEFEPGVFNYRNDSVFIQMLKSQGIVPVEKQLPSSIPINDLIFVLNAEAAAAFDDLTRSGRDTLMVRQMKNAWPNVFRAARLIPAVEYIQANRIRYRVTEEFNEMMSDIDVLIAPTFSNQLPMTNLTGHPCVVLPDASYAHDNPGTVTLIGNHFDEASILQFARYLQEITSYEQEHPPMFRE